MKIGIDACCWSNKRGFGRFTRELLGAMTGLGLEHEYRFFVDKDTAGEAEFPEGVEIFSAPTQVAPTKAASASGRRSARDLWAMTRTVMKSDFDIFFFPAVYSYFPVYTRAKVVVTIHDLIADLYPELVFPNKKSFLFWKMKQNLAVKQADLILTVSKYSKTTIMKHFRLPENKIRTISEAPEKTFKPLSTGNGIKINETLSRYRLSPDSRFIIYVGGISPHKNLATLIDAYNKSVRKPEFSDLKLVLVGDYTGDAFFSSYQDLKKMIKGLDLEDKVVFTGFTSDPDLVYLYNAASLMAFPSLQEGFGLPAVEAMACGTPVAASNAGSLPEIIGEAGRFFDPASSSDMQNVIEGILLDDALRGELSRLGLIRAKEFSWVREAKKTLSIFQQLLDS